MKRTVAFFFSVLLLLLTASPGSAVIYLDFTKANFRKIPMAVPPFEDRNAPGSQSAMGWELANRLAKGLQFHGFIQVLANDPGKTAGYDAAYWKTVGADFAVLGTFAARGSEIDLDLRLVDNLDGKMAFGRRYQGPASKRYDIVLKFCDEVIKQLTGEPGISRTKIAFVSDVGGGKDAYVSDIFGESVRQVTRHKFLVVSPRFSPDGSRLAYTSYHPGTPFLYVTDLRQNASSRAISRRKGMNHAPAWSPDGSSMILTLSEDGNPDLYLMTPQGEVRARLTRNTGLNVSPSFSPDGRQIAFVSDRSGTPQIYIMDLASRATRRLTYEGLDNSEPNWSPKGDLIVFSSRVGGSYQIYTISPEGGKATPVTSGWGDSESPSWSPDGRQIVFSRKRKDVQQLCVVLKNGSGLRVLFDNLGGRQSYPQWGPRVGE